MVVKREMIVRVSKKEAVAAALPIQHHWLPQSNLDLLLPPLTFGVFFCYRKTHKSTFGCISGVLKAALAESLVYYYALAGEVVQNFGGEPELLCNNRGVAFVEAFADIALSELNLFNPDESIENKLVPVNKHGGVLAVQVTELKCGGVVVGCSFDHRVADAYSANMFLVSWSEVAQAKPLSQLPCFRRSFLFPRRPGHYDLSVNAMYTLVSSLPPPPLAAEPEAIHAEQSIISRIYYMESDEISRLQSLANNSKHHRAATKLAAFSAFLWKTIATGMCKDYSFKNFKLGIVVDGRTRLRNGDENHEKQDEQLKGYFGNVLSIPFGDRKIEDLKAKPLSWAASVVHEFLKEAVTREHFLGLIDWVEAHRPEPALAKIYACSDDGPAVVVSSGQQFPARKIDFGWGKPAFGSYHFPWGGEAGYVMPMPSPKENGDWIVYMHLQKWQLALIEAHASHLFKPLTSEYLDLN